MLRGLRYSLSRGLYLLAISIEVMPYPVKALWRSRERVEMCARGEYLSPSSKRVHISIRSRRHYGDLSPQRTGTRKPPATQKAKIFASEGFLVPALSRSIENEALIFGGSAKGDCHP
jgi:hypothetical protein